MGTAIRNWVVQTMMKGQTGVVRTLPKPQIIELNTQITIERMLRNGINPEDMKTVGQVDNVVKQIDTPKVNVNPGVTGVKKADVLDMEGNKIDTSKGIMGGKQIQPINMTVEERTGGLLKGKYESDEAIKTRLVADNEKNIASMKKKLDDPEEKADGGRIGLLAGSVPKISAAISALLKNKKKVQAAVDDIFPTGDYKYDADMAADALVENNPKEFNNLLREDLSDEISSEIYGTVLKPIMSNMAEMRELRKATRPEKTLQSMKEGKGIDISDPEIADEFTTFMKERDPKGYKELEQKVELSNFKTKGRKENSDGGRIGLEGGTNEDFQKYLKERERFEKERSLEQLFKEYKEDLRRKGVMEQKQMAADGGRIGLKAGMTKRGFLKLMGGVGASIGAAKSGIFSGFGKGAGKTVAKEVAQQTTSSTPPPYFFNLVNKIKTMGDDAVASQDKAIAKTYKDYVLEEDFAGNIEIKKTNYGMFGDEVAPTEEVYMSYRVDDVPVKGKKGSTKVEEYEEYTARPDEDGKMKDVEDGVPEDVVQDGTMFEDNMTEFGKTKKASGGIARMLGE